MRPLFFFFLLVMTPSLSAQQEQPQKWAVNGYVKQLQGVLHFRDFDGYLLDNLFHNRVNLRFFPDAHWTFAVDIRNRAFYGDLIRLNASYAQEVELGNNDYFDMSYHWIDRSGFLLNSTVDRAYAEYVNGDFEARIGRQRINWGIATVWNPNDLFNAYSFTDFDYEERPGTDALRAKYYLGFASSLELAGNMADSWSDRVISALYKGHVGEYDFQLLTGVAFNEWVCGGGWAGNLKGAAFKGEWTYFYPLDRENATSFALTTEGSYVFKNGISLGGGYLYNSNGRTLGSLSSLFDFELSSKNLYPFRHALMANAGYPLTPLINAAMVLIYSPIRSYPLFVNPTVTYSIAQNWDIDVVMQLAFNKEDRQYVLPLTLFFLRIKYSF